VPAQRSHTASYAFPLTLATYRALVGSNSNDVLDAIFEVGIQNDESPFLQRQDLDEARSPSVDSSNRRGRTTPDNRLPQPGPARLRIGPRSRSGQRLNRQSDPPQLFVEQAGDLSGNQSPLAQLFGKGVPHSRAPSIREETSGEETAIALKRMETMLESLKDSKTNQVVDEVGEVVRPQHGLESGKRRSGAGWNVSVPALEVHVPCRILVAQSA
jgi:hypothetical protein